MRSARGKTRVSIAAGVVVLGGILLGALLGGAAQPRLKAPQPQWWQTSANDTIAPRAVPQGNAYRDAPLFAPDGFRPDLDYDAEVWSLPLPTGDLAASDAPLDPYDGAAAPAAAMAKRSVAPTEAVPLDSPKPDLIADGLY